jgi:hypothetical protein
LVTTVLGMGTADGLFESGDLVIGGSPGDGARKIASGTASAFRFSCAAVPGTSPWLGSAGSIFSTTVMGILVAWILGSRFWPFILVAISFCEPSVMIAKLSVAALRLVEESGDITPSWASAKTSPSSFEESAAWVNYRIYSS